ncbi:MAG: peptide chain release factor N(5)-glutamine methyltransferase [Gammaproteobacteria bacterium]|nr:peptide chain release factor N(5)-glutamine methyltransferase [Gammaproteobacteria bacterium]
MKTVQDYLNSGACDIAPLLSLVLGKSNTELYAQNDYTLGDKQQQQLENFIQQREQGVPFAYLSGKKGFYHLDFKVTKDTLIPRPETELLIDITLDLLNKNQKYQVLDLGTGSGIIAITLADINPRWKVSATDFSQAALSVAKINATTNINFTQGSWFGAVTDQAFDLIVSNPPYIEEGDAYLDDLTYEPITALTAGKDGLDDIRIIIDNAPNYLQKNGFLLLEHGHNQQDRIVKLLEKSFINIQTFKDYNSNDRAILAQIK